MGRSTSSALQFTCRTFLQAHPCGTSFTSHKVAKWQAVNNRLCDCISRSPAYNSKKFQKFDYGSRAENRKHYGQDEPPVYPVENITNKHISLIWSKNDWLASSQDIAVLKRKLTTKLHADYLVPDDMTHAGFLWGKRAGELINTKVLQLLNETFT